MPRAYELSDLFRLFPAFRGLGFRSVKFSLPFKGCYKGSVKAYVECNGFGVGLLGLFKISDQLRRDIL